MRLLAQGTRRRGPRAGGRESAASCRRPFPARTGGSAWPARGSASLRTSGSFRGSLRSDADRCEELRISYSMRRGLRDVHSFAPLHSQQFRTWSSKCVLIFLRTFGAGGPRRWSPRRSSPSSRAACGRASRARAERKITLPLEPRQLSQVSNRNAPIWIKCRLATYERGARVGTIRKTTNGHHHLALALTHHGVRKEKKLQEGKISEKRILLVV